MATINKARTVVRMPIEKKLDRQIDICRFGARRDRLTVILEREHKHKVSGHVVRREPLIEITPDGDVREFDAPRLRTRMVNGIANDRMRKLVAESNRLLAEAERKRQEKRSTGKRQQHRPTPPQVTR